MAELFIAGPLLNLGVFLGKWLWKKYKSKNFDKQHSLESDQLYKAVSLLSKFANEKAAAIQNFNSQFGVPSTSLGCPVPLVMFIDCRYFVGRDFKSYHGG